MKSIAFVLVFLGAGVCSAAATSYTGELASARGHFQSYHQSGGERKHHAPDLRVRRWD